MEELLKFFKEFNIQTIMTVLLGMWYFTRDIKTEIRSIHKDLKGMDTLLSRLEGTTYGKDLYNQQ
jgi:hypothetical protein